MLHTPDDRELDECPFDWPAHWIARALDAACLPPTIEATALIAHRSGVWVSPHVQALKNAVLAYSDAVFKSDDRPDRCRKAADDYANQHRVTVPAPPVSYRHGPSLADKTDWSGSSKTWDSRTRNSAPIVLAVVSGPYYALSLVVHGSELRIHNLDGQGTIVRVALA